MSCTYQDGLYSQCTESNGDGEKLHFVSNNRGEDDWYEVDSGMRKYNSPFVCLLYAETGIFLGLLTRG